MALQELYELFLLYDFEQHFCHLPCDIREKGNNLDASQKDEKIKKCPNPEEGTLLQTIKSI